MLRMLTLILLVPAVAVVGWLALRSRAQPADFTLACEEPRTLDPHRVSWMSEIQIASTMFEGLTRSDPATLRPIPGVAESWEVRDEGRTYLFHLRTGARWSNGQSVSSEDFAYSWLRVLDPVLEAQYASLLFVIRGARDYYASRLDSNPSNDAPAETVGIESVDGRTLRVELAAACPYFLDLTSFPTLAPVHRATIERYSPTRATRHAWLRDGRMVSNGAFVLETWEFKTRVRLIRNPHYWDSASIHIDTMDVLVIADPNVQLIAYESGRIEFMRGVATASAQTMVRQGRGDLRLGDRFATYFFRVNCVRPPFDNAALRRALALAIDREAICAHVMGLGETPARTLVPPSATSQMSAQGVGGSVFYQAPAGIGAGLSPEQRADRARESLRESGFDPASRTIRLSFAPHPDQQRVATAVMGMWESTLGLRVELEQLEGKVLSERIRSLDYDVVRSDWYGDYLDPSTFLELFTSGSGQNRTGWANPEYDDLIARASVEVDAVRRFELFRRAEAIVCERELPVIPIFHKRGTILLNPRWAGLGDNLLERISLERVRPVAE